MGVGGSAKSLEIKGGGVGGQVLGQREYKARQVETVALEGTKQKSDGFGDKASTLRSRSRLL